VVLRLLWYFYADQCTVFWFPSESESPNYWTDGYVAKTLGRRLDGQHIRINATPAEVRSWSAAATAYVDEVAAAARELKLRKEGARRRWGPWRWMDQRRLAEAEAVHRERFEAAQARYRPVLGMIEQRVAEAERAERAAAAKTDEERKRRIEAARARFEAWERRQALADRPLFDGRSARELAASSDTPSSWPSEIDDPESWWAGVQAAVRNETARVAAVQAIADVVTTVAAVLEETGRPGISAIKDDPGVLHGWWVEFDWSGLPSTDALTVPPDIPVSHIPGGEWHYFLHLPSRKILLPRAAIASATTETLKNSIGTRHHWSIKDAGTFANFLLPRTMLYRNVHDLLGDSIYVPMTEHADPDAYVPYVRAVAECAAAAFTAFLTRVCGRAAP
jgi:hypothetical protein